MNDTGSIRFIDIGRDFTTTPGWRYMKDGDFSGEEFRTTILSPALRQVEQVVIDLDAVEGFTSSFLEEVFGGVVREFGSEVVNRLVLRALRHPRRVARAEHYMKRAIEQALSSKGG